MRRTMSQVSKDSNHSTCEKPQVRCVVRMALVSIGFLSHRESRAVVIHDPYDFQDSEECE